MNRLTTQLRNRWRIAVFIILILAVVFSRDFNTFLPEWRHVTPDVESKLKILGAVVGVNPQFIKFINPDFEEVRIAKEIGEIVGHNYFIFRLFRRPFWTLHFISRRVCYPLLSN